MDLRMFAAGVLAAGLMSGHGQAVAQAAFDPRDPSSLISVLAGMDARAELHSREGGAVRLNVITPGGIFGAQFLGCGANGRGCQALGFTATVARRGLTLDQANGFNGRELLCRVVIDGEQADIRYGLLLSDRLNAADMRAHVNVWQGCLNAAAALRTP